MNQHVDKAISVNKARKYCQKNKSSMFFMNELHPEKK